MSSRLADVLSALSAAAGSRPALALIGATARNAWAPPRATTDIDLAVAADPAVLEAVKEALQALGYEPVRSHRADPEDPLADLVVLRAPGGSLRQVDLLVAKTEFETEALRRAVPIEIAGVTVPVATPEDLIVYKLVAYRPRDRQDIAAIARTQGRAGRLLDRSYIRRWAEYWGVADRLEILSHGDS